MTPRLLATDLDGTLLLPDLTVSPRVTAALDAARAAGITVVVLTARSWRSVQTLPTQALGDGLAVCSNGALVYDLRTDTIVQSHALEPAELRAFLARVRATVDVVIGWETATRVFRTPEYHELAQYSGPANAYLAAVELADDVADDHRVTKLFLRHRTMGADDLHALVAPLAASISLTVSGGPFVEVMAPGITKAHTLAALCDELGVAADEVVAVGDHTNDLPMLKWAGRGVAMGNAHPSVLAATAEHTAPNTEDGLARVIESLLT